MFSKTVFCLKSLKSRQNIELTTDYWQKQQIFFQHLVQ